MFIKRLFPFYLIPVAEIQTTKVSHWELNCGQCSYVVCALTIRLLGHPCMCNLTLRSVRQSTFSGLCQTAHKEKHYTKLCYLYLMKVWPLCVVLVWCCQVCPLNNTEYWSLGTWGLFWTRVMNTVEAVKSANSCMEMQSDSPNCQWVWESPSVHAFALWWGWEQLGSPLLVFNFPTFMFQFDKPIWTRLRGSVLANCALLP